MRTFKFDGVHVAFLQEPHSRVHRLLGVGLISAKRQVCDDKGTMGATGDSLAV